MAFNNAIPRNLIWFARVPVLFLPLELGKYLTDECYRYQDSAWQECEYERFL